MADTEIEKLREIAAKVRIASEKLAEALESCTRIEVALQAALGPLGSSGNGAVNSISTSPLISSSEDGIEE
jgi:hypothetical protein